MEYYNGVRHSASGQAKFSVISQILQSQRPGLASCARCNAKGASEDEGCAHSGANSSVVLEGSLLVMCSKIFFRDGEDVYNKHQH